MKTRTEVLDILRSLKDELRERYHIERIALFGPYAHEEQGEGSDIDMPVEFGSGAGLPHWSHTRPLHDMITSHVTFQGKRSSRERNVTCVVATGELSG